MQLPEDLSSLIPHGERMSLIDSVIYFSDSQIELETKSHLRADNVLLAGEPLCAAHLFEYAAQGTAIHAALTAGGSAAQPMFIGALRNVELSAIDFTCRERMKITCTKQRSSTGGAIYEFVVAVGDGVVSGRVTLVQPDVNLI